MLWRKKPKTIEERVNDGAAWLDQMQPGWHKQINLRTLNLMSPYACVLGQLYGDDEYLSGYSFAVTCLMNKKQVRDFGFDDDYEQLPYLENAWFDVISKRLGAEMMEIGTEGDPYTIEPIEDPVPQKEPAPAPAKPRREREKVPA